MKRPLTIAAITALAAGGIYLATRRSDEALSGGTEPVADAHDAPATISATGSRPSPTPVLVRKLIDPALHIDAQIEAIRALPDDLSGDESRALVELLREPAPDGVRPGTWYTILNEIMEVLRQPHYTWAAYAPAMAELVGDRHVDPVVRDYAAQHLALYLGSHPMGMSQEALSSAMGSFLGVLHGEREAYEGVTGTILMSLCDLRGKRARLDFAPFHDELGAIIGEYVSGARPASMSNQISSIQAAGRMGYDIALPAIRRYAGGDAPNESVRLSSVAALGYFGREDDLPLLRELAGGDEQIRFAAKAALKRHAR